MLPNLETLQEMMKILGAAGIVTGAIAGFWRKDGPKEDEIMVEAIDVLIDNLSDADKIALIEKQTGRNMKDQWSVEQVVEWSDERKLRRWQNRN